MHTLIFILVYTVLYKWCDFGRLRDGLELPPLFWGVMVSFIFYDLIIYGIIPTEE